MSIGIVMKTREGKLFIMALNLNENKENKHIKVENLVASTIENEADFQAIDFSEYEEANDTISNTNTNSEPNKKLKSFFYDLIFYAVMIFVCIYIIPNYVMQRTIVDGSSMANTLYNAEHLMVEKISYRFDMLNRFDIIVFYPYGRDHEEYYVKRLIGLPGETVQIVGSDIMINGEILVENFGKDPITFAGMAYEPITLEEDEYFVMGDNREISKDSRYPDVGKVSKENIGGRAFFRIWPLNRFGTIK